MNREEVAASEGKWALVNAKDDIAMRSDMRPYAGTGEPVLIVRLTKAGMVMCIGKHGTDLRIPPRNLFRSC